MVVVYKARDVKLQRLVALKVLLAGGHVGEEGLARFWAEARAAAGLHHANIVPIFNVGEHDGLAYFTMEYVGGGNLAQKLRQGPLPVPLAAGLVEQLAWAAHCAHQQGILHRDLKPANVLFTADGTPKIADFGLAKRLDVDVAVTATGVILGSPAYMPPEQAQGDGAGVGPAADVYSLGALLYETLTGRPPFRGHSALDILDQVRFTPPRPPSQLVPQLPRDIEVICLKCLEKDPRRRYPSAEALANDLARFLAGEHIVARPFPVWERSIHWLRRWFAGTGRKTSPFAPAAPASFSPPTPATAAGPSRTASAAVSNRTPATTAAPADRACFTVTSRPVVRPGSSFTIDVWTHADRQQQDIFRRSQIEFGGSEIQILKSKGPVRLLPGSVVAVRLFLEPLLVEDAEDTLEWSGDLANSCFRVKVPEGAAEGTVGGLATLHVRGEQIAKVPFVIEVGRPAAPPRPVLPVVEKKRRVFVSYASDDRDEVLHRIQGMQKAAPHLEFFLDVLSLRSGQDWEGQLRALIPTYDIFYLFWSDKARRSEWVEKEWRCALQARGLDFIDPIPLVSPEEVPPPPELASKHFNDWVLPFLRKKQANSGDSLFLNVFKHVLLRKKALG
jgi:serine/threonine protein kinase